MLPWLRKLSLSGDPKLDWDPVFHQRSNPAPTRPFFINHQHIHTLIPDWMPEAFVAVDPNEMQELFPALRHFVGHDFLCIALVQSDLLLQLESLCITSTCSEAGTAR
jgi:hypothetical protein